MAEKSKIVWTDATWNPWSGCTPVSEGCANCYMYREKLQFGQDPAKVVRSSDKTFYAPLKWREPRYIFTCSWGDFFHPAADEWRPDAWDVIRRCPQHTWLTLTKRPELIADRLPEGWPWPHVALGITVENQERLEERGPYLLSVPAPRYFLSWEPGLGPLDLEGRISAPEFATRFGFGWIIAGGESGPNARPIHPEWVRSLRDQAVAAGVPFCFKQWGEWAPFHFGEYEQVYTFDLLALYRDQQQNMYRIGRKAAGRKIDGEIWDERPEPLGKR